MRVAIVLLVVSLATAEASRVADAEVDLTEVWATPDHGGAPTSMLPPSPSFFVHIYDGIPVAIEPPVTAATSPTPLLREEFHPLPVVMAWLLLAAVALWRRRALRDEPHDSVAP